MTFDILGTLGNLFRKTDAFGLRGISASTRFNDYTKDRKKLSAVLSHPALLKIVSLQCDLFSLGKVFVYDKNENLIEDDPFLKLLKNPNPFQSRSQFLWDFMFWNMLGTANLYVDSKIVDKPQNKMYFLSPYKIEWPRDMQKESDKLIFSDKTLNDIAKTIITYRYEDGSSFKFPLDRMVSMFDLTNGVGNWYKSPSRIDALHKIISNSEHSLDAKNINVRYTGKFLVGSNGSNVQAFGLGDEEKTDIENKMDSEKSVWPLKTMIKIQRFVDDLSALNLDQAYLADYYLIGNMFNIPRDVLEAYVSSTFENQEKARMAHVSYTLQPKGNDFFDSLEQHFGYIEQGKNIVIDWSHLPFTQIFEQQRVITDQSKIATLQQLLSMGVSIEEANQFLDLDFKINGKETNTAANQGDQIGQGQGN